MIIIPTEKRFDWKHTPVVLFSIVLLNILVFFTLQSSDDEKVYSALDSYHQLGYLESEWPVYEVYLKSKNKSDALFDYRLMYRQHRFDELGYYLLTDFTFHDYLSVRRHSMQGIHDFDEWQSKREALVNQIREASYIAYGLTPAEPGILTFLSHQFLHGDIMHLLGNLFFLIVCGFAVEAAIGHLRFLIFYLISGIAGGLMHVYFNLNSTTSLIGASGAISGVMAMYLGVFRFKKIEFFYWLFIFVGYFRAPALFILPFYIGNEVFNYMNDEGSNVAFMAHTGGFIAGILLMLGTYFYSKQLLNHEYIEQSQDANPQQQMLASVYNYIEKYQFQSALKLLQNVIDEFGNSFQLAVLKYNLLKPAKDKASVISAVELLKMEGLEPYQIKKLEDIWLENPLLEKCLKPADKIKIAWRFSILNCISTAEKIFDQVFQLYQQVEGYQAKIDEKHLAALAEKIALVFQAQNQLEKMKQYRQYANLILS